jgi:4-hydroxybenzoate polyprenyltransferase
LGGLVSGAACAAAVAYAPKGKRRGLVQAVGLMLVFVALVALSWFRVATA